MKRRQFIKSIGVLSVAATVNPLSLVGSVGVGVWSPIIREYTEIDI